MTSLVGKHTCRFSAKILCIILCFAALTGLFGCGTEEKDKKVKITIPAIYLTQDELEDLDTYCENNGYYKASYNKKDDTVTLTMTKFINELLLTNVGMKVISCVYDLVKSETFPYFLDVKSYEKDFTKITISVNKAAYTKDEANSLLAMTVGQSCLMYGMYTVNENPTCEVTVVDSKTGDVLYTIIYDTSAPDLSE